MSEELCGRRVALIGGAGFIGHHLALGLAKKGAEVHIIDSLQVNNLMTFAAGRQAHGNRELYLRIIHERLHLLETARIPLYVQDARDYHALSRILAEVKPHVVVHLAAVAHAGRANKNPYATFDHSLRTLENALDYAPGNAEHFIYLSSSMVYGTFQHEEVDEEHPLNPLGIYGALKLGGEKLVIAYQQVFGLPYTIIRPSALYGPRCVSRRVGQMFIESALEGSKLVVHGDGGEKLDFTYIDDLVEGIGLAIETPAARNQAFNMTCGHARSIQELVQILQRHFPHAKAEYAPRDELMPVRNTLSVEKARRLLGYAPKHSLEEGMARYIAWYRSMVGRAEEHAERRGDPRGLVAV